MRPLRRSHHATLVILCVVAGACESFDVQTSQFGIFNIETQVNGDVYSAAPRAVFFNGTGVELSSSNVTAEGCRVQTIVEGGTSRLDQISAGPSIAVRLSDVDAALTPQTLGGRTTYELADGVQIPFTPGDQVTFTVPGAANGFPARVVTARTAENFTPAPVTLPVAFDENLVVTWTSQIPVAPRSAMSYSFRYTIENAPTFNREVFCVFVDDGSGIVPASALQAFRATTQGREIVAQRARITIETGGSTITHVTSTLTRSVALTDAP